jgi:membrane protease subunit HflK
MLTTESSGDQSIAEVTWVVQYKIDDPVKYLYRVKNVKNTIRDVSEAAMRLAVGDKTFDEVIGDKRVEIGLEAQDRMREVLDSYNSGIYVQTVKLMSVKPPANVADSFNRVVQAEQDKEVSQNIARKDSTNTINLAIGERDRKINEAQGYKIATVNQAEGDVARFLSVLGEFEKDKTKATMIRLYLESVESVLSKAEVVVFDEGIKNVSPLINLDKITLKKND